MLALKMRLKMRSLIKLYTSRSYIDLPGRHHPAVPSISFEIYTIAQHNSIEYYNVAVVNSVIATANAIIISILFRTCLFSTSFLSGFCDTQNELCAKTQRQTHE